MANHTRQDDDGSSWTMSYTPAQKNVDVSTPFGSGFSWQTYPVSAVALSTDGKRIAFGGWNETVQVYDIAENGNFFSYNGHSGSVSAIAWSPDKQSLASASHSTTISDVQIWDSNTGTTLSKYQGHASGIGVVAWSPDGRLISSGSYDQTVQVWDPFTGNNVLVYHGHSTFVKAIAWSPDGSRIASIGGDGIVYVWDAASGNPICTYRRHSGMVNEIAWSPDGSSIASAGDDKTIHVWNAETREQKFISSSQSDCIVALGWSVDGSRIRFGSSNGMLQELDAINGSTLVFYGNPLVKGMTTLVLTWTPDMKHIAWGIDDRKVIVSDILGKKTFICRGPSDPVELVGMG